jgi:MerR family transcriptional regulator, light-induced transcriptional regulator
LDKSKKHASLFSIAAVEREVGISKDVLRVWERRYGFPTPVRDARGERAYSAEQVARLSLLKRLMDGGHRPGRLIQASTEELRMLLDAGKPALPGPREDRQPAWDFVSLVRQSDSAGLEAALQRRLAQEGLGRFVLDTIVPLANQIGEEWARGSLEIHEEHLLTEAAIRVLRQAISQLPAGGETVVMLTTLSGEPHSLGLLMVECLLALQGARCINLGTQMPVLEVVRAAQAHRPNVVGLSFSSAFPARLAPDLVRQLRTALPPDIDLWAGGAGAAQLARIEGVRVMGLADLQPASAAAALQEG